MKNFKSLKFFGLFLVALLATSIANAQNTTLFVSTLSRGSRGIEVTNVQRCLVVQGFLHVSPTGYFGFMTEQAVREFQVAHAVVSSGTPQTTGYGRVGPRTLAVLNATCENMGKEAPAKTTGANSVPSSGDVKASVKLTATKDAFNAYTISWISEGMATCSSNDFYINDALVSTSGSVNITTNKQTTYTINCLRQNGSIDNSMSASVVVNGN